MSILLRCSVPHFVCPLASRADHAPLRVAVFRVGAKLADGWAIKPYADRLTRCRNGTATCRNVETLGFGICSVLIGQKGLAGSRRAVADGTVSVRGEVRTTASVVTSAGNPERQGFHGVPAFIAFQCYRAKARPRHSEITIAIS